MKFSGAAFIFFGVCCALVAISAATSDIQLILAASGICMAGIGGVMIGVANIRTDVMNVWLWVKEIEQGTAPRRSVEKPTAVEPEGGWTQYIDSSDKTRKIVLIAGAVLLLVIIIVNFVIKKSNG
jgi:hypothetical protein